MASARTPRPLPLERVSAPTRFKSSVSPRANREGGGDGVTTGVSAVGEDKLVGGGGRRPPKVQGAREAADFLFGTPGCGGGGGAGGANGRGTDVHYLLSGEGREQKIRKE